MAEKLLTYAIERGVEAPDMPTVRHIVRDSARQNYKFSSLVLGVVKSPAFQMRLKAGADDSALRTAQSLPERLNGVPSDLLERLGGVPDALPKRPDGVSLR
jgi:hypothetical protein